MIGGERECMKAIPAATSRAIFRTIEGGTLFSISWRNSYSWPNFMYSNTIHSLDSIHNPSRLTILLCCSTLFYVNKIRRCGVTWSGVMWKVEESDRNSTLPPQHCHFFIHFSFNWRESWVNRLRNPEKGNIGPIEGQIYPSPLSTSKLKKEERSHLAIPNEKIRIILTWTHDSEHYQILSW